MQKKKTSVPSSKVSGRPTKPRQSRIGQSLIRGMKEAAAFMRGEISLPARMLSVPEPLDVKSIRSKLGLSQGDFAKQFGFSARTVQEWEQGRATPDSAVRAYLTVIDRNPKAVSDALSG